jgi:hypothetical protein
MTTPANGLSPACGPHCGITGSGAITREGHCNCEICHDGEIPPWARDPVITIGGQVQRGPGGRAGTPMCERQGTDYLQEQP